MVEICRLIPMPVPLSDNAARLITCRTDQTVTAQS